MKDRILYPCILLALLVWLDGSLAPMLYERAVAVQVASFDTDGDAFREMKLETSYLQMLKAYCNENGKVPSEYLTAAMALGSFQIPSAVAAFGEEDYQHLISLFLRCSRSSYETLRALYRAVWDDVETFPVQEPGIVYENSWMFERTYGGLRGHEGTDLIPPQNLSGYYRVVSMTDGIVEQKGWLEKGGYRIGIRSPSGGYFYYAHLDSYAPDLEIGDTVSAGQLLGYMGDTGYGEERTRGRFAVHLHLGIYVATDSQAELSVNPYWVLRYAEIL
jgi:murein DD-endopeptidase MepM/ murein hydrolase activator NlpD